MIIHSKLPVARKALENPKKGQYFLSSHEKKNGLELTERGIQNL